MRAHGTKERKRDEGYIARHFIRDTHREIHRPSDFSHALDNENEFASRGSSVDYNYTGSCGAIVRELRVQLIA